MSTDFNKNSSSDIRDDLPGIEKNYKAIQRRNHEFWIKVIVTVISLIIVVISFGFLLHFSLASKFRPHTIYDFPVIISLSVLPVTILVILVKYFYKNENNNCENQLLTIPQIEAIKSLISSIKNICNK